MKNILIAKVYDIVYKFDIEVIIKTILKKILKFDIFLILCIYSKFLYNYLVRLEITKEKHLIINIINLYQLYKRYEIIMIK